MGFEKSVSLVWTQTIRSLCLDKKVLSFLVALSGYVCKKIIGKGGDATCAFVFAARCISLFFWTQFSLIAVSLGRDIENEIDHPKRNDIMKDNADEIDQNEFYISVAFF